MPEEMEPLRAPTGMQPDVGKESLPMNLMADDPQGLTRRPPVRREKLIDKKEDIEKTSYDLVKLYRSDLRDRDLWSRARVQRTAKYRGWREKKTYPWEDASNCHLPIIMTDVQRTEDTLHNAVLSSRPVMNAVALAEDWTENEKTLDDMLDFQIFVENMGEERIGALISNFTQEGMFIAYCPYVKERQELIHKYVAEFPTAPTSWEEYLHSLLRKYYPNATILPGKKAPWEWTLRETHPLTGEVNEFTAKVYMEGDTRIQVLCKHATVIFDGPALIPLEIENVVVPHRAENLQPVTLANPKGAHRVIMVDYPSRDEIRRLYESKFYDLISMDELNTLLEAPTDPEVGNVIDPQEQKILKDDLLGINKQEADPKSSRTLTRLTIFTHADLDGDGLDEEVIYWMIEEPRTLLRVRYLTEVYPIDPPRRPFACAKYIPVNEQFYAIGLLEMMESGYDIIKRVFDQMMDSGELSNTPFGFYRPMSGIRPENMRMSPGDLAPTNDPKNDVYYPTLPQGMSSFGHNIITLVSQILDNVTLVGQLQLGGVPQGRASALRTTSNMQSLLQQGDARPERVLRRFFRGLAEIWQQFYELDQVNLPKGKMYRVMHGATPEKNPFRMLEDPSVLRGRYTFDFSASILNTNKALATSARQQLMGVLVNPLMLQLGLTNPQTMFNLIRDFIRDLGQEPMKYLAVPPGVQSKGPLISAEQAVESLLNGRYPVGSPLEPLMEHVAKLQTFASEENLQNFSPGAAKLFGMYAASKVQELMALQQQQQMMMAAEQFSKQQGGQPGQQSGPPGQGGTQPQGPSGNPMVGQNEALDETLPGAGGGGNQGVS